MSDRALLGEWVEHSRNDGTTYLSRDVDGFEDMMIDVPDDGENAWRAWIAEWEAEFDTFKEAEAFCFERAIEYVKNFQSHGAKVLAALTAAFPKPKDS